jgi:hypothetical protein
MGDNITVYNLNIRSIINLSYLGGKFIVGIFDKIKNGFETVAKTTKQKVYDFDSIEGIESITVADVKAQKLDTDMLDSIEYVLQRKATEHKKNEKLDLAIACLRKSNELMPYVHTMYGEKEYMRLVEYLKMDRQFDEARIAEADLREKHPEIFNFDIVKLKNFNETLKRCKEFKTDLVECTTHELTCEICSKYQGRIFSTSGKDKRFPKLPDEVYKFGGFHEGCRHSFYAYFEGSPTSSGGDPIKISNRPFVDKRTKAEKVEYEKRKKDAFELSRDKKEYDDIWEKLPDIAPKSFGGYRKMKNTKSKNYLKLVEAAKEKGIDIN